MIQRLSLLTPLAAAVVLTSCAQPPTETIRQARESGQRAFEAKAGTFAPEQYQEYEYALERARRFQMEEDTRFLPPLRDYSRSIEAFQLARERGDLAREESLRRQEELATEVQTRVLEANYELADARDTLTRIPVGADSRQLLAQADVLISQASRLLALGEYDKAAAAAGQALEKVGVVENRAGHALDRYQRPELLQQWGRWVRETVEWSRQNSTYAIVVDKSRHTCTLFLNGVARRRYAVNLGVNGFNQKLRAGDLATPEGRYRILRKQDVGQSRYYKALLLDYPNQEDWQRFLQAKRDRYISQGSHIGSLIMLHGEGRKNINWTQGCVALENTAMDEVFRWVEIGTPVTIVGRDPTHFASAASPQEDVVTRTQEKLARKNGRFGS